MTIPSHTASTIAYEALDALTDCHEVLKQIEATLKAAMHHLPERSDAARIVTMTCLVAMDRANGFDCIREDLLEKLDAIDKERAL